jgi:hypothetical protein
MKASMKRCAFLFQALAVSVCLITSASGQRRMVVDSANGPGTHYTDLDPAVAASQPGDVIIVRPGTGSHYTLNRDIRHGIRIVAPGRIQPIVAVNRYVRIPAGQLFVIDNIVWGGPSPPYFLRPQSCAGTVIVSRMTGQMLQPSHCARIVYTDCSHVFNCCHALLVEYHSTAYVLDSEMLVQYSLNNSFWRGGVSVDETSRVWIVNSRVKGGTRGPSGGGLPEPGLILYPEARAHVAGRCDFEGGAGFGLVSRAPGIELGVDPRPGGRSSPFLILDPATTIAAPRVTHGNELLHESPTVSPGDAIQGQPQTIDVMGPTGSIVAVFAGLLTGRAPIETSMGDIWLDGPVLTLGAGAVDANRDLQLSMTIPSWLPQGEVLVYQVMSMSPQSLFEIGPPGFAVVQ